GGIGVVIAVTLSVMEVSLSFDNAVVNASVLKNMDEKWRKRFLLWGILIAVFGMRLLFPVLIVSMATGLGLLDVSIMALNDPKEYAHHLQAAHVSIAAFGGMFLLLVFLSFVLDDAKEVHWLKTIERGLSTLGKLESVEIVAAMGVLIVAQGLIPEHERLTAVIAGMFGIVLFVLVGSFSTLFEERGLERMVNKAATNAGLMSFIYLEILDASFSLDGVVGAFAITSDVVIIMIGLAIGAMFVRSLTVFLVEKGTLEQYIYLEHGAHYAIGALALLMLASIVYHIPEVVTGLIGVAFILMSLFSSIINKRMQPASEES
ncbi:MAG: DUF475 domain-containing protein, partial [Candidatus Sericytochromatia bacterium]